MKRVLERGAVVKILLVDDSELVRRHVSALLSGRGWTVNSVADMAGALTAYQTEKPTALLVDFVLTGGYTGLEVVSAAFALSAGQGDVSGRVPAAILTLGNLSTTDQGRADFLGVPVIQKPTPGKEQEFLQNIEFWLHQAGVL